MIRYFHDVVNIQLRMYRKAIYLSKDIVFKFLYLAESKIKYMYSKYVLIYAF